MLNILLRFEVSIGLSYDADVEEVTKVMCSAALQTKGIVADPPPSIRLLNFGDSQLEFVLMFWTDDVFRVEKIKSELRLTLLNLLREKNINIPYPQMVIHTANNSVFDNKAMYNK